MMVEQEDESLQVNESLEEIRNLMSDIETIIYEQNRVETVAYTYAGLPYLEQEFNEEVNHVKKYRLFVYTVNKTCGNPFLMFLLHKKSNGNFMFLDFTNDDWKKGEELLKKISTEFTFRGWAQTNDDVITLCYEIETNLSNSHLMFRMNDLWFLLLDEILNHPLVLNEFDVSNIVRSFFYETIEMGLLKVGDDDDTSFVESPCVMYAGFRKQRLDFYATFGNPMTNNEYVFRSFDGACDDAYNVANRWGDNNAGGIIRFACFPEHGVKEEERLCLKKYEQQCGLTFHYLDTEVNRIL
jgi:hypothetical protein